MKLLFSLTITMFMCQNLFGVTVPKDIKAEFSGIGFACIEDDRPADGMLKAIGFGQGDDGYYVKVILLGSGETMGVPEYKSYWFDYGWNGYCLFSRDPNNYAIYCSRKLQSGETISTNLKADDVISREIFPSGEITRNIINFTLNSPELPDNHQEFTFLKSDCGRL